MSLDLPKCPVTALLLPAMAVGCADRGSGRSTPESEGINGQVDQRGTRTGAATARPGNGSPEAKGSDVAQHTATKGSDATTGTCPNPDLGHDVALSFVTFTGTIVNGCIAGNTAPCSSGFRFPTDVAIDYGNFPFSRRDRADYFYAVVAEGYEDAGFFDGAVGNLSDNLPSAADGDTGGGDTAADRTIVVGVEPFIELFPSSPGTHRFSFPPAQFMTIHLAPFDTTPSNRYAVAICPTTATSHCDCAFSHFRLAPPKPDAGPSGAGGASGSNPDAGVHVAGMGGMCPDR